MKNDPGGVEETIGGDRETPLQFYQQLGEERIYSVSDYLYYLRTIEDVAGYKRETAPNMSLKEYLELEENRHWGIIEYSYEHDPIDAKITLHYDPWLNKDKNIVLEGRMILNINTNKIKNKSRHKESINDMLYLESTFVDEELCWIEFPAGPKIAVTYDPVHSINSFARLAWMIETISKEV